MVVRGKEADLCRVACKTRQSFRKAFDGHRAEGQSARKCYCSLMGRGSRPQKRQRKLPDQQERPLPLIASEDSDGHRGAQTFLNTAKVTEL